MVIRMSARMHELVNIVSSWEREYRKDHTISSVDQLIEAIYENAPQEVIDAYEEMIDDSQDTNEYQ